MSLFLFCFVFFYFQNPFSLARTVEIDWNKAEISFRFCYGFLQYGIVIHKVVTQQGLPRVR